jgi:ribose 1,5-bisphosphate isomerase
LPSKELVKLSEDIKTMRIRGAAEIGRAAVNGLAIAAETSKARTPDLYMTDLDAAYKLLISTRPTAVSLPNALRYVMHRVGQAHRKGVETNELKALTLKSVEDFKRSSIEAVARIADMGAKRILNGDLILTHCNSSVALDILCHAKKEGKEFKVIATETRPRFQGRLTAKVLSDAGIPVTLIIDSAARYFMPKIDKVVVGADVVTSNGAIVNKIGTSQIALAAREARVRVFVGAETYKFSPSTILGELVEIEQRPSSEIIPAEELKRLKGVNVANPAFDVTPPEYIDIIITERGVISPQAAVLILMEEFGWSIGEEHLGRTLVEEES